MVLDLTLCERGAWFHCICGVPGKIERSAGGSGVCSGDSGGPVIYHGIQVNYFITTVDIKEINVIINK